jgi:hypothetical protein
MPLKAKFYQIREELARGVTNPVFAAKARLQTTFVAGKIEIKRFFNWGIGYFFTLPASPDSIAFRKSLHANQ